MSTTIYESPEGQHPQLSIDITNAYVWFFEHTDRGGKEHEDDLPVATCRKEELPAIARAMLEYLDVLAP